MESNLTLAIHFWGWCRFLVKRWQMLKSFQQLHIFSLIVSRMLFKKNLPKTDGPYVHPGSNKRISCSKSKRKTTFFSPESTFPYSSRLSFLTGVREWIYESMSSLPEMKVNILRIQIHSFHQVHTSIPNPKTD